MMLLRYATCCAGIAVLVMAAACPDDPQQHVSRVTGTWGGENAGVIATDTSVHVHVGCTYGDISGTIIPDASGHFAVDGTYNVDAYPVDRGILHPAHFSGTINGKSMVFTVALADTARTIGPATVIYGKEPRMGPCPICRDPSSRMLRRK